MLSPFPSFRDLAFTVIMLVCGNVQPAIAQTGPKIDSLLHLLENRKDDNIKVDLLNQLSKLYNHADNAAQAMQYAQEAFELAKKMLYRKGIGDALNYIGSAYSMKGEDTEAVKYYHTSLSIREEIDDKIGIAGSHNNLGRLYHHQTNFSKALVHMEIAVQGYLKAGEELRAANTMVGLGGIYTATSNHPAAVKVLKESARIFEHFNDKDGQARSYANIATAYMYQGNYPEAVNTYLLALKINEQIGRKAGMAIIYGNISAVHAQMGNYSDALVNNNKAFKIFDEIGDKIAVATVNLNKGRIYMEQGNYAEGLHNISIALKMFEEFDNRKGISDATLSMGRIYHRQKNYVKALETNMYALKIDQQLGNKVGIALAHNNIASVYLDQNKIEEASENAEKGLIVAQETGDPFILRDVHVTLAAIDSARNNYRSALEHYKLAKLYADSIVSAEKEKKIDRLTMQYEFSKREDSLRYQHRIADEQLKQQLLLGKQQEQSILLNESELLLVNKENDLQQLQLVKTQIEIAAQRAETEKKQGLLAIMDKERTIQNIELKRQRQMKNYLLGGMVLLCMVSFFAYNNYRTRQQLKLQTLRNRIASDLHDDVGSTLSSISIFSQMAQEQSKEVIPALNTIGESSRKMLDAMADIVWTINPENDQFEKIVMRMRSFAYELLGAKKIEFRFVADDDVAKINLSMETRKNLYLIFKEATNNLVKYAEASRAVFTLKKESNELTMIIRDDGKGFNTETDAGGNGLKNMKKRALEIGANLFIDSVPGDGTTIRLQLVV
jgi:signal transduction histidine kinase